MTPRRAMEFLLDAACHNHRWECNCVQNGRIQDDAQCSCGATEHNQEVFNAIKVVRESDYIPASKHEVGIESPMFKYDGYV